MRLLDQTLLPDRTETLDCRDVGTLVDGDAAAAAGFLTGQRPTAVNLGWACRCTLAAGGPERDPALLAHLWVDETRPLLQGARLTAFEAAALGIPHAVVVDGAAGALFGSRQVDAVLVGADRIAANGDTANGGDKDVGGPGRRGGRALLRRGPHNDDRSDYPDGDAIEIEQRDPEEVRTAMGRTALTPAGSPVWNPASDVTPAALVTAIVTERGVARPPYTASLREL